MPIYNYHCDKCNKDQELIKKLSDEDLPKCEECGKEMEKTLTAPGGFQFKGTKGSSTM